MSSKYANFRQKLVPLALRLFERPKVKESVNSLKSILETNRHFDIIKTSFDSLTNNVHAKLDRSVNNFSSIYDKITGRESVRKAGVDLLTAEQEFLNCQLCRRNCQQKLFAVQKKRSEISKQLDLLSRADDAFLPLITKEHELAREEADLLTQYRDADISERAAYEKFASLLRYLHAEERTYDMRMRQWALIGSITVGFLSAFVTWLRFRSPRLEAEKFQEVMTKFGDILDSQAQFINTLDQRTKNISSDLKRLELSQLIPNLESPNAPNLDGILSYFPLACVVVLGLYFWCR
uniref:Coiled-coil domain-containing protein 51 n=1 Tax=Mesocestoides corti TaxID=53468 RepID=A0A5K3EI09_MESCO